MPDSAPEEYKKLAELCCDADPDKRPDARTLRRDMHELYNKVGKIDNSTDNLWNAVYYNDVKPLSRLEKESKYSSIILPTGSLPNNYNLDSAAGMKTNVLILSKLTERVVNLQYQLRPLPYNLVTQNFE